MKRGAFSWGEELRCCHQVLLIVIRANAQKQLKSQKEYLEFCWVQGSRTQVNMAPCAHKTHTHTSTLMKKRTGLAVLSYLFHPLKWWVIKNRTRLNDRKHLSKHTCNIFKKQLFLGFVGSRVLRPDLRIPYMHGPQCGFTFAVKNNNWQKVQKAGAKFLSLW